MLVALQEYVDKRMGEYAPKVVAVHQTNDTCATFKVSLGAKEPAK
jgi:hypothetical protein